MNTSSLSRYFESILKEINLEKDKLIELDQAFGDGDLGVSMASGFKGVYEYTLSSTEEDFGKYFLNVSKTLNESAPSSLGTILSFFFMGMAKSLKGKNEANLEDFKEAFKKGVELLQEKANSKVGEKTILDSLVPAVDSFCSQDNKEDSIREALVASEKGMLETKNIVAVHGRAAYHKEKTLGHIDGGSYLAYVIFRGINNA